MKNVKKVNIFKQKKFVFIPIVNAFIICICTFINKEHFKSKGAEFGFWDYKYIFNVFLRMIRISVVYTLYMLLLSYIKLPETPLILLVIIGMYVQMTLISWSLIRYQRVLGLDED